MHKYTQEGYVTSRFLGVLSITQRANHAFPVSEYHLTDLKVLTKIIRMIIFFLSV